MVYYVEATLIAGQCELRRNYRHCRADRITSLTVLDERYPSENGRLVAEWMQLQQAAEYRRWHCNGCPPDHNPTRSSAPLGAARSAEG
jgi:predicted DNA-binding transcriptional regulator YafY